MKIRGLELKLKPKHFLLAQAGYHYEQKEN